MAQVDLAFPVPAQVQPSAKHFSSNAVRAIFRGFKDQENSPTLSAMLNEQNEQAVARGQRRIAIFEVIEALAYKRLSAYASQQMTVGQLFKVELDVPVFGQAPENTELVKTLQVGEEVVAKVDEVFVFDGQSTGHLDTPLVRVARRNAPHIVPTAPPQEEIQAQDPEAGSMAPLQDAAPLPTQQQQAAHQARRSNSMNRSMISVNIRNGVQEKVELRQSLIPGTNEVQTRMFINDVEVDPHTKQPLSAAPAEAAPQNTQSPDSTESTSPAPLQTAEPLPMGTTF